MRLPSAIVAILASLCLLSFQAHAQSNEPAVLKPLATGKTHTLATAKYLPVPEGEKLAVPTAKLMRVDEGVFELEFGKTIDLTDRKILLSIGYRGSRKECCILRINGKNMYFNGAGTRLDFKRERHIAPFVEDKSVCFLDVVDIALPRGTNGIATFRLHCI